MPGISLEVLQKLELDPTELIARGGPFSSSFLAFPFVLHETLDELPADGRDLVVFVGKKDRVEAMRELCDYTGKVVAAFGPGDAGVAPAYLPGRPDLPENVVALFSPNNLLEDERSISVPLGVAAGKVRALQFVRRSYRQERDKLCYGNFTVNDSVYPPLAGEPHIRTRLANDLEGASWMTVDLSDEQRKDPRMTLQYYAEIARHRFVLSPRGRGIDCYRTWEALYLGAVPIVMSSPAMSAFSKLPILFTDDYSELSEAYLEERWQELASRSFQIERMLKSWYFLRFLAAVAELESPRFVCLWEDGPGATATVMEMMRSARLLDGLVHDAASPPS